MRDRAPAQARTPAESTPHGRATLFGKFVATICTILLLGATTLAASQDAFRASEGVEKNSASVSAAEQAGIESGIPEILVRGSRILNMDIRRSRDDAQPYVVFEREQIDESGATSLENFLRERLPMNAAGLENSQRVTQAGSRSSFNLRGLGATQTLILIDGHRTVSGPAFGGSSAQPDVNGIPLSAVERIEVLPATSSGIYGGSATGGVINIITRQDYSGAELIATYGNTFDGPAPHRRFELSAGTELDEGKTQLTIAASYSDEDAIALGNRRSLVERYYARARANAPATIFPPGNPPLGATPNIRSADGSNLVLDSGTALNSPYTFVPAGYAGIVDGGSALVPNAGRYNLDLPNVHQFFTGALNQLGQDTRIAALRATVQHEFSERVRVFVEGSGSDSDTRGNTSGVLSGSPLLPYRILAAAPTNPFTTDILVTLPTDSMSTVMSTATALRRIMGGVIFDLGGGWNAEADYTWARDRTTLDLGSQFTTGSDTAGILTGSIDVLRDVGQHPVDLSSHMADPSTTTPQKVTFNDVAVRFSGPLFNMPTGPVTFSSLLEYRQEKVSETLQVFPGLFNLFYPGRSARTYSAYVESRLPLARSLEFQIAGRFDKYRTVGKTGFVFDGTNAPVVSADNTTNSVNPTLALRYQPVEDVAFRLSWGTGFVPPDASQLAPSQSLLFEAITDPRRGNSVVPVNTPLLQGGNPDLDPESSENWSAGVIFTPHWAQGLRVSVDYTRIEKADNISSYPTGLQGLLNDEALFPSRISRGPNLPTDQPGWAGPITLINSTQFNISKSEVEAVDVQLDYTWTTRVGAFTLSAVASKTLRYETQSLAGQPIVENVGNGYFNPQELSGNAQLNWRRNAWKAGWATRFYDSYLAANSQVAGTADTLALQGNGGRVDSQAYHDVFVSFSVGSRLQDAFRVLQGTEVRLGVRNVFNELPPFDAGIFLLLHEYYSPLGDALRRNYALSLSKQF